MIDKRFHSLKRSIRVKCGRGIPHYIQIYEGVQCCLENNQWKKGEKFSSLEELARLFGVSRLTVKHAIKPLLESNILISKRGKGLFVNKAMKVPPRMSFAIDWKSYIQLVEDSKIVMLESTRTPECPWDLTNIQSTPTAYQHFLKVHSKGDRPYGFIETYFDAELYDLSPRMYSEDATLVALEKIRPKTVHAMNQIITVTKADSTTAEFLKISTGDPIAVSKRTAFDKDDKLIYIAISKYPGEMFETYIEINIDEL